MAVMLRSTAHLIHTQKYKKEMEQLRFIRFFHFQTTGEGHFRAGQRRPCSAAWSNAQLHCGVVDLYFSEASEHRLA